MTDILRFGMNGIGDEMPNSYPIKQVEIQKERWNRQMDYVKNEEYVVCPRCEQEVYKDAAICPFCKFGIMAWLEGEIDENGDPIKDKSK